MPWTTWTLLPPQRKRCSAQEPDRGPKLGAHRVDIPATHIIPLW